MIEIIAYILLGIGAACAIIGAMGIVRPAQEAVMNSGGYISAVLGGA